MERIDWLSTLIAAAIGAIISMTISHFYHKKSEKTKRLSMLYKSDMLQTINYQDIKLLYKEKSIDSLTKTLLLVVNSGQKAVKLGDVGGSLVIKAISSVKLLSVEINKNSEGIKPTIKKKDSSIELSFSHLNPKDYIFIEILHEGILSHNDSFIIDHNPIIDGSVFITKYFDPNAYTEVQKNIFLTFFIPAISLLFITAFIYRFLYIGFDDEIISLNHFIGVLNIFLYSLMAIASVYFSRKLLKQYTNNKLVIESHKRIPNNVREILDNLKIG